MVQNGNLIKSIVTGIQPINSDYGYVRNSEYTQNSRFMRKMIAWKFGYTRIYKRTKLSTAMYVHSFWEVNELAILAVQD